VVKTLEIALIPNSPFVCGGYWESGRKKHPPPTRKDAFSSRCNDLPGRSDYFLIVPSLHWAFSCLAMKQVRSSKTIRN